MASKKVKCVYITGTGAYRKFAGREPRRRKPAVPEMEWVGDERLAQIVNCRQGYEKMLMAQELIARRAAEKRKK